MARVSCVARHPLLYTQHVSGTKQCNIHPYATVSVLPVCLPREAVCLGSHSSGRLPRGAAPSTARLVGARVSTTVQGNNGQQRGKGCRSTQGYMIQGSLPASQRGVGGGRGGQAGLGRGRGRAEKGGWAQLLHLPGQLAGMGLTATGSLLCHHVGVHVNDRVNFKTAALRSARCCPERRVTPCTAAALPDWP